MALSSAAVLVTLCAVLLQSPNGEGSTSVAQSQTAISNSTCQAMEEMRKIIIDSSTIFSSVIISNSCLELTCTGYNDGTTFTLGLILLPCSQGVRVTLDTAGSWMMKFNYTFLQSQTVRTSIITCGKTTYFDTVVVLDHLNQEIGLQVDGYTQEWCQLKPIILPIVLIRYITIPLDCQGGQNHKLTMTVALAVVVPLAVFLLLAVAGIGMLAGYYHRQVRKGYRRIVNTEELAYTRVGVLR